MAVAPHHPTERAKYRMDYHRDTAVMGNMEMYALRIPKAASQALVDTLKDIAFIPVHEFSLTYVPEGKLAWAIMRDPVQRFRSAFDMYTVWPQSNLLERFPTVDDFVAAGPEEWMSPEWGCGYWKAKWWLRSAEYVRERGAIVLDYRTFNDDLEAMGFPRPGVAHPTTRGKTTMSADSVLRLKDYYADDYRLMEELWR
jgi:hypothetical protein